jgi:hypothetical protein
VNLSNFQSQARIVTPDGKMTPEFLRLFSAIVRDLQAVTGDQSLDVFASAAGLDVSGEVMGYETVTQSTTEAQEVFADVTQPLPTNARDLVGDTLASNVENSALKKTTRSVAGEVRFDVENSDSTAAAFSGFGWKDFSALKWKMLYSADGTGEIRLIDEGTGNVIQKWTPTLTTVGNLRIDQTPTAAVTVQSHYLTINLNGTDYKMLLGT